MTTVTRQLIRDYYAARVSLDPERIAPFLDDDVQWSIDGPVELLNFCGELRGKQAVLDGMVSTVPALLDVTGFEIAEIVIEGDQAATFSKFSATHAETGRAISYHCAQFLQFRDGKIVRFRVLMDTLDAAEQVLGHRLDVTPAGKPSARPAGNRIAI